MEQKYMELAIRAAEEAAQADEVPVGAVLVRDGEVLSIAANRKERDNCALSHAEMLAIGEGCRKVGNWYLDDCDLYVTLEPCPMCAGGIINSRLRAVYFGAYDPKSGALGSVYDLVGEGKLNHRMTVEGGIRQEECGKLLSDFFAAKRAEIKQAKADKEKGLC